MTAKEHWESLSKNEKRFLKNYVCGWCEHGLDNNLCYDSNSLCSDEKIIERRKKCLKNYKPRKQKDEVL